MARYGKKPKREKNLSDTALIRSAVATVWTILLGASVLLLGVEGLVFGLLAILAFLGVYHATRSH